MVVVQRDGDQSVVPHIDEIVIGKVMKVNARFAIIKILCCGESVVSEGFSGTIRFVSHSLS